MSVLSVYFYIEPQCSSQFLVWACISILENTWAEGDSVHVVQLNRVYSCHDLDVYMTFQYHAQVVKYLVGEEHYVHSNMINIP